MKRELEITLTPKEIGEQLFNLSVEDINIVFESWKDIHDKEYDKIRKENPHRWYIDFDMFLLLSVKNFSAETKNTIRSLYAFMITNSHEDAMNNLILK